MNIIEERRRRAWSHAMRVIWGKVIDEVFIGGLFIYGETIYGIDYFITPHMRWTWFWSPWGF